jgi:hypothetical protein
MEWSCGTCTFLNPSSKAICAMCHKSRPTHDKARSQATSALLVAASNIDSVSGKRNRNDSRRGRGSGEEEDNSIVIDAVENFLRGSEWRSVVNEFVNSHCAMFAVIDGEHGHGQHDVFLSFHDTVEGLLDGVLSSLGSSPEKFIDALKEREHAPERGPRDAAVNNMIRTLMTFERFDIFKVMMHERNKKLEEQEYAESNNNSYDRIIGAMGGSNGGRERSSTADRYSERASSKTTEEQNGWNCVSCSFYNDITCESCEMCATTHFQPRSRSTTSTSTTSNHNANSPRVIPRPNIGMRHNSAVSMNTFVSNSTTANQRSNCNNNTTKRKGRKEIKASERKTPFQALCTEDYHAEKETEMSIATGEMIVVMDNKASTEWWWAECPTRGAKGWVPVAFLTIDQETKEDQEERLKTLSLSIKRENKKKNSGGSGRSSNISAQSERNYRKKSIRTQLSTDSCSSVDEQTFRTMMPVSEDRKIRKLFEEYDRNRSGTLFHEELNKLFSDVGLRCSDQEINESMILLKTFSYHNNGEAERMLIKDVSVKDLMKTMKREKMLDRDGHHSNPLTLLEFYNIWRVSRDDSLSELTGITNRVCDLRVKLGEKYSIFFGFNFDDWQSANNLNRENVINWSTRDVAKWVAFENDLAPIRKYLTRDALNEIDGESLLDLNIDYLINDLKIKSIHIKKILNVINRLRVQNGLDPMDDGSNGSSSKIDDYQTSRGRSRSGSSERYSEYGESNAEKGNGGNNSVRRRSNQPRQKNVGAWRRGDLIGQGAYGKVYQGFSLEDGSLIAVKQILTTMDDDTRREIENEISVMSRLKNDYIVRYLGYQWDQQNQQLFIFTEWVPGGSLSDILKKFGKLDSFITARYTKQMLFGLKYLHEHDVIHLDIKPGNVLIDNLGCVKLADFGASRKLEDGRSVRVGSSGSKQSDTVEMLGTPYFMAPEIIRQERHGRKADIWSVAGTVLNMFTGVPPWAGSKSRSSNVMALLLQIEKAKGPPPYPNELQSPFTSGPDETPDVSILFPL